MARSDDALRRITHERLHAVARRPGDDGWPPAEADVPAAPHRPDDDPSPAAWLARPEREPEHSRRTEPVRGPASEPERTSHVEPVRGPRSLEPGRGPRSLEPGREPRSLEPAATAPSVPASHQGRHRRTTTQRDPAWPVLAPSAPLPVPEPSTAPTASGPAADDARDVVERMRREALTEVAAQYSQRHGHPLEHPSMDEERGRWRWFLTVRHAVVAGIAVAVLTAGVVVRATAEVPDAVPPVGASEPAAAPAPELAPPVGSRAGAGVTPGQPAGQTSGAGLEAGPGPTTGTAAAVGDPTAGVVVHVVGQVHAPGVVELPTGSRVGDAVRAAGGATDAADLSVVNLARVLVDGEQVVVPAPGEAAATATGPAPPAPSGGGPGPAGGPVVLDLNAAGPAELDALPGVGPVIAQRILDWRTDNGPFRDVDELAEVAGIGETLLARLRPLVRV